MIDLRVMIRRRGELLFVAVAILVDVALSYPSVRSLTDFLFVEGMAATIIGSFLVAQSLKPSISISDVHENSGSTRTSLKARTNHRALGMRILIVGIFLLLLVIVIGEIWIRKLTYSSPIQS
jgi:hypothetical protein